MATIRQKLYGTISTVLTTELNALATSNACTASAAQGSDATTAADLYGDFELLTGGSITPGTGARADLYLIRSADGTNYEDATTGASESLSPDAYAGSFYPTSGAGTKRMILRDVPLPPGLWKAIVLNEIGVSLAATGNTLKLRPHSLETV